MRRTSRRYTPFRRRRWTPSLFARRRMASRTRRTYRRPMRGRTRTSSLIGFTTGQEYKFYDTHFEQSSRDDNWPYDTEATRAPSANNAEQPQLSLNLVKQGAGPSDRIGRKFTIRSINVRITLHLASVGEPSSHIRIIIYQDKQCNGTGLDPVTPSADTNAARTRAGVDAAADMFRIPSAETATSIPYLSYYNLVNRNRFKILYNKIVSLNSTASHTANSMTHYTGASRVLKFYHKCNIPIEMDPPDTVNGPAKIDHVRSNNIGMMFIGEHNGSIEYTVDSRIRFSDS